MISYNELSKNDSEVAEIVKKEGLRQANELELIASENYVSEAVLEALASPLANKYSEGYPGARYYGGNQVIDEVENLARERAKLLFQAEHVNVQPLSGSPANAAVYFAMIKPGDKVMGLRLDHGGHLSHGHPINFSGLLYNFVQYGVGADGRIDMEEVRRVALAEKPKMIVAGFSAYSRDIDWQAFKDIADEIGAITFADISHPAGLIAAGLLKNPVPIFDVVMTTTHKTLRGPRGAIIMCKEQFAKQIDRAVFPGMQGGPHDNMTAAKAVAFGEALKPDFKIYAAQVIKNAQAMANKFIELGYEIVSGGTDNHMFVIDLRNKNLVGKIAEIALEKIGISISRSTIPNDPNPPMNPSGIRIGTPAITTRGLNEKDCELVAELIDQAIINSENESMLEKLKSDVKNLCAKYPLKY
ncbi:MAG: serine hydroxymethyltransferase [Candidatus Falkowbacteria bacterium]|nr:serine hydroxymethyltransferase [Candidatus Falkowbacteria bacterium]